MTGMPCGGRSRRSIGARSADGSSRLATAASSVPIQSTFPQAGRVVSTPYLAGRLCNKLQLGPLVLLGKIVSLHGGGKSTLRAQRQLFQREHLCGLINAAQQLLPALKRGALTANQSEDHGFVTGNEAERLKATRAPIVVLQQKAVNSRLMEEPLGERVTASLRTPVPA